MLTIQQYYTLTARTLNWIGLGFSAAAVLLASYYTVFGWERMLDASFTPSAVIFLAGPGNFILAAAKKRRAESLQLAVPDRAQPLAGHRRLMIVPFVHWLREYVLFTLDGQAVARIHENVSGFRRIASIPLHVIGLRAFLKKSLHISNQNGLLYRLEKKRGLKHRSHLYHADGTHLGYYDINVWNPARSYTTIFNPAGEQIGENHGGFSGMQFEIRNQSGNPVIQIKYEGIPTEALETFSGVRGDIIDYTDAPEAREPLFLLAPVIVQLHFLR
ncbi:hypothetical protein [Salisediminibacterium halotolerans]|uniref:hypothetical protein n=1 Tax=Salisediminibacterium halotolerans TaxID=517425 RepID=UPI000EAE68F8|nr:hypothetical protein [Salisediminibacterium halotolerans]RLJ75659.1 hypothetical protein BCL39_1176 [Actinophytocola xinjiangensis]RPE89513.1 hypothetical protein EDD67_0289 [Salisediminibacterium halotolerans]TWG36272.1 hypothetical protein BCL52_1173 [Salisediminibacterium halotolerans]GEL07382.1 hypothetical protein SHA02_07980 [Salisediminibacterium halotolerans]